jgi:hypothetical protein
MDSSSWSQARPKCRCCCPAHSVADVAAIAVRELHESFDYYLAVEQPVEIGVNGRVARRGEEDPGPSTATTCCSPTSSPASSARRSTAASSSTSSRVPS